VSSLLVLGNGCLHSSICALRISEVYEIEGGLNKLVADSCRGFDLWIFLDGNLHINHSVR